MVQNPETRSRGMHVIRLLKALSEAGRVVFTTSEARELAAGVGVPEDYVRNLLLNMIRDGWLIRLRRGLYAVSGLASGQVQIHPFAIATQLVIPSAISHWSALSHHGLTEQAPRVVTAFTPKKVVTPSMRGGKSSRGRRHAWDVAGVRYEYVSVRQERFFGIEQVWVDENFRVPITDRERTVLEVFISCRVFGGMGEALGIIENHLGRLDVGKLVEYARRFGQISTAKRLGWALERAGVSEAELRPLLEIPATGYHALDPTRSRRGPCDKRWMIQNNLAAEANP
ncbi:MAG TPA: type IV toxin-antitoxin system AbiEi family antitoxin domain-containing protein [bacterium]|nr:type IV toxin-antitoxin system AbiEi family antitoxin domain-containing protein [bacterium]